jgi:hypothetical protein
MAVNPGPTVDAIEPTRAGDPEKLPLSVGLLITTALSLTLWYGVIQGTAFGYAQIQSLLDTSNEGSSVAAVTPVPASTAKPEAPAIAVAGRPDATELVRDYNRRLADIDQTLSATIAIPATSSTIEAVPSAAPVEPRDAVNSSSGNVVPMAASADGPVRDVVLEMLREFGLVSYGSESAMSAAQLDSIVGGQAEPGMAADPAPDDEAADPSLDALNRVLVEGGGLLLAPWTVELQPETRYSYKGANGLLIREQDGQRSVISHSADLTKIEAALTARMGLPWRSQIEARVPYVRVSEESSVGGNSSSNSNEHGLGDIEIGLSHQLLRESSWTPDLIGEVRYRAPTGDDGFGGDDNSLPVGSGFHGITGRLTAVKTLDPVVFLGSVGYTANLKDTKEGFDIDPGDSLEFGVTAILAAGPGVSLRTGFGLAFTGEAEVDNEKISGSDKTEGVLNLGGAVVLPGKNLLDLGVGVGVTDDAPDVAVRLALTHRF